MFAQTEGDLRWCTFEIRQGDSVIATWKPKRRIRAGAGAPEITVMDLSSPQKYSVILLSDLTQVPVGSYILRVTTNVKYGIASLALSSGNLNASGTVANDTFDIPLLIKPLDETAMRNKKIRVNSTCHREN